MTLYVSNGASVQMVVGNTLQVLNSLREALAHATELERWAAGVSLSDLESLGMPAGDAQTTLSAIADAKGLADLFNTGTDSRNPGAGYVYGASVRQVIGSQVL